MTWTQDEQSIQGSQPIELYLFQTPSQAWYLTSYRSDVVTSMGTFTAVPMQRSNVGAMDASDSNSGSITIDMPASHSLPQFYANGIPPRQLTLTVYRQQKTTGFVAAISTGYITALSFKRGSTNEGLASFRMASPSEAFSVDLPTVVAGRTCPHQLFDARCTVHRVAFTVNTTITSISQDRKTVTVATMGQYGGGGLPTPSQWALSGELYHPATTERRVIGLQNGLTLILSYRLPPTVNVGDVVAVSAGCAHTMLDCFNKFANQGNFGGFPQLPLTNPFFVTIQYIGG